MFRLKNISRFSYPLQVYIKDIFGKSRLVSLAAGASVYTDNSSLPRATMIYQKKRLVELLKEELPAGATLYKPYTKDGLEALKKAHEENKKKEEELKLPVAPIDLAEDLKSQLEIAQKNADDYVDDEKPKKKKRKGPGRPPKRGRPKKKRPIGRPKKGA